MGKDPEEVFFIAMMDLFMKVYGKMIRHMITEESFILMEMCMKEIGLRDKLMVLVNIYITLMILPKYLFILENLKMAKKRDLVNLFGPIKVAIQEDFRIIKFMAKEFINGVTEEIMKETGKMEK